MSDPAARSERSPARRPVTTSAATTRWRRRPEAIRVALPTESVYCMSKAAVAHLTKCLAVEWGRHGITVNAVAPTFIRTPGTAGALADPAFEAETLERIAGLHRIGEPMEVAGAVVFLASPAASLITGHTALDRRRLDGPMTMAATTSMTSTASASDAAAGFPTVFGRELIGELPNFVHRPYLVVTMADLWPRFEHLFDSHLAGVHQVDDPRRGRARGRAVATAGVRQRDRPRRRPGQ